MAQTKAGAVKIAAAKCGVSLDEYLTRMRAGIHHCTKCRMWKPAQEFCLDRTRPHGRSHVCSVCRYVRKREAPGRRERAAMAQTGKSWCRGCAGWLPTELLSQGACRAHLAAEERARYGTCEKFRYARRNKALLRRRGVEAVPPEGHSHLLELYGGKCVYCCSPATTIDHLHPVSRGGRTTPGNVVPACRSCNSRKKDMELDDWLKKLLSDGLQFSDALVYALEFMESSLWG